MIISQSLEAYTVDENNETATPTLFFTLAGVPLNCSDRHCLIINDSTSKFMKPLTSIDRFFFDLNDSLILILSLPNMIKYDLPDTALFSLDEDLL